MKEKKKNKTALAESYSQGFTDGRKQGHSEGYELGLIKGYEQGYAQAKRDTWEKWGWRIDRNG